MVTSPISRSPEFRSAPSSPPPFGDSFNYHFHCSSAPASPTRGSSAIYYRSPLPGSSPAISPASELFDFSFDSGPCSDIATADELFHKGRIRSLHPPPPPSAAASPPPRSGEKERRRCSPVSTAGENFIKITTSDDSPAIGVSRRWRLKDILLFRSASEGRPIVGGNRDHRWKYAVLSSFTSFSSSSSTGRKKGEEESRCRSFSSSERGRGGSARRGAVTDTSAHEIHYTVNRAAAEERRKKTPLPYQPYGMFSCLRFNPAIGSILDGFNGNASRGRS
ncbi:hypothetical protein KSP39_PZI010253 [Platanthera zijinensis]|uniref:Uncharacterized protein n=1 Tax=Platanthera zijinensis TaxID=2320716 RepID=A0AAP0BJN0_9ASPA